MPMFFFYIFIFSIFAIMEYNTLKKVLFLPEYGRIIQSLVDICMSKEKKEDRNEMAEAIIELMTQRFPKEKDEENYLHKLWDHLFILSNYQLDVDSPFPIPSFESLHTQPRKMLYPKLDYEYKFYGKSILQLIDVAIAMELGEEKNALVQVIANNMKKSYNVYNKEHVQDEVIIRHLNVLSKGELELTQLESLEKSKIYAQSGINHNANNNKNRNNKLKNRNYGNSKQHNYQK